MWICLGRDVGLLVVRIEQIEGIEEIGKMAKACDLCHFPLSYYRGVGRGVLFHDAFLKVFGEVGAYFLCGTLGCYLCHVAVYHDVYKFLKTGL